LGAENFAVHRLSGDAGADWPFLESACSGAAALVLDGYHFDPEYQLSARQLFRPLVVIDDTAHLPCYHADILINHNICAENLPYRVPVGTRTLLGCRWALLRREFRDWRGGPREVPPEPRNILVTLGGADPDGVTLRALEALHRSRFRGSLRCIVLAGAANPRLGDLRTAAAGDAAIELRSNAADMPPLMAWADLAITAGGSTCWETAFMGLPTLTIVIAENQERVARGLDAAGAVCNLGWFERVEAGAIGVAIDSLLGDPARLEAMSAAGRRLVDGTGALAVAAAIRDYRLVV
jgi:UDP-2,4-diacetamido-2,4,6-trideoxy-beta-L-altropyranose hydrolase